MIAPVDRDVEELERRLAAGSRLAPSLWIALEAVGLVAGDVMPRPVREARTLTLDAKARRILSQFRLMRSPHRGAAGHRRSGDGSASPRYDTESRHRRPGDGRSVGVALDRPMKVSDGVLSLVERASERAAVVAALASLLAGAFQSCLSS